VEEKQSRGVHKNTVLSVLSPPARNQFSGFRMTELPDRKRSIPIDHHDAIHARLRKEPPFAFSDLQVFGEY
jgi:hypothetical protein